MALEEKTWLKGVFDIEQSTNVDLQLFSDDNKIRQYIAFKKARSENKHSILSVEITRESIDLSFSHIKIDKITLNLKIANLLDKQTKEDIFSESIMATFWGDL